MSSSKIILSYRGAVQTWECDSNGHMNVMYYINKFELAGRNCAVEMGMTKDFLQSNALGIAVVEQNIKYLREVFVDDLLYVHSRLKGYTKKVFQYEHELWNREKEALSAVMDIKLVIFDLEARKAVELPNHITKSLDDLLGG